MVCVATSFSFVAHDVLRDSQREMIEDGMEVLNLNGYGKLAGLIARER